MTRLTHERVSGIKTGYWSPAKKEELVQRLAAYENTGLDPEEIMDGRLLTGWTPADEKLPAEPEPGMQDMDELPEYIVTIEGAEQATVLYYAGDGEWFRDGDNYRVDAWMPLPEACKAGK